MKRIVALITIMACILSAGVFAVPTAAVSDPTITVSTAKAAPGETVVLSAVLDGNPGINAMALTIEYDEAQLELLEVAMSAEMGGNYAYSKRLVWGTSSDITYNGTFLSMTFKVSETATGSIPVSLSYTPGDICNYDEEDVDFSITSGGVTVEEEKIIPGDVSDDGRVNSRDTLALKKYNANIGSGNINLKNADVSGDGRVNSRDAIKLKKMLSN